MSRSENSAGGLFLTQKIEKNKKWDRIKPLKFISLLNS